MRRVEHPKEKRICSVYLALMGATFSCKQEVATPAVQSQPPTHVELSQRETSAAANAVAERVKLESLRARLGQIAAKSNGTVGISVVHVESGRSVAVDGQKSLPLQSVFKLPLAVAVLRKVQAGQLGLDEMLTVRAEDRAPGVAMNEEKWEEVPRAVSIRQLLEYSLVDSDNTSSDKLLELIGGPGVLTEQMRSLGFDGIVVRAPTKAMGASGDLPNDGTPDALAGLLASLERGDVLEMSQRTLLWDLMRRARTGKRRIRAGVPPGTPVLDKTGTGSAATNDVGVLTLPGDGGHLTIAVLIAASSLPTKVQEDLIAETTRTVFDAFAGPS